VSDLASAILGSSYKAVAEFPGKGTLRDMLNFGFSYVETEDNMVTHILAYPSVILKILRVMPEAELDPEGEVLGSLFTAKLLSSKKVKENRIVFANEQQTVVLVLITPEPEIESDADV
jgi:hypothetical protein